MYRTDNPGGRWLAEKQEKALRHYDPAQKGIAAKGLGGAVTAWATPAFYPVEALRHLTGVCNETRAPGDVQYEALLRSVTEKGWDPEQDDNSVLIGVNHLGEAYVIEGNTRLSYALRHGIPELKAEIRWFNGAEDAPGPFLVRDGVLTFTDPEDASPAI